MGEEGEQEKSVRRRRKKNDLRSPSLSLSQHFFFSLSEKGGKKKEERALVSALFQAVDGYGAGGQAWGV